MALTTPNALTIDGSAVFSVTSTVQENLVLPGGNVGTDTVALLTNAGPNDIAVAMGNTASVLAKGIVLRAGQSEYVSIAGGTTFSAVQLNTSAPNNSALYVTTGT